MAYVKIENNVVVYKTYEIDEALVYVPDSVCCGMIQNADGTFSNPTISTEELMDRLRQQRNQLLTETDWRMVSDYPGANQTEWQTYRQALRNITTQSPSLDENGQLTGITWPTPPTD